MTHICPIASTLDLLGRKWNLLILKQLSDNGKKRFNEMTRDIEGISSRTLSKRLVELETAGLITRVRFDEIPPRVEYSLTEAGTKLIECFEHINTWVKKYK